MTPIRMCCPYCSQVTHLAPGEIFLALDDDRGVTGDYAYTCPQCLRTGVHAAAQPAIAALLAAGVAPLERN